MAADMLTAYYSLGCDSKKLFQGLEIAADPDFEKHLNKYNTIFINVQEFLSRTNGTNKLTDRIQKIVLQIFRTNIQRLIILTKMICQNLCRMFTKKLRKNKRRRNRCTVRCSKKIWCKTLPSGIHR